MGFKFPLSIFGKTNHIGAPRQVTNHLIFLSSFYFFHFDGSEVENVQSSMLLIKKVEKDRFNLPCVKVSEDSQIEVEDSDCDVDHLTLGHLCGDLTEEVMDDSSLDQFVFSSLNRSKISKNVRYRSSRKGQAKQKTSLS